MSWSLGLKKKIKLKQLKIPKLVKCSFRLKLIKPRTRPMFTTTPPTHPPTTKASSSRGAWTSRCEGAARTALQTTPVQTTLEGGPSDLYSQLQDPEQRKRNKPKLKGHDMVDRDQWSWNQNRSSISATLQQLWEQALRLCCHHSCPGRASLSKRVGTEVFGLPDCFITHVSYTLCKLSAWDLVPKSKHIFMSCSTVACSRGQLWISYLCVDIPYLWYCVNF